jgi:hypothetical protein
LYAVKGGSSKGAGDDFIDNRVVIHHNGYANCLIVFAYDHKYGLLGKKTMSTIRFTTDIGPDLVIRPPVEAHLTPGLAEVIVVQPQNATEGVEDLDLYPEGVPEIVRELVRFASRQTIATLPPDFAINHDHYLHGSPKGIDQP